MPERLGWRAGMEHRQSREETNVAAFGRVRAVGGSTGRSAVLAPLSGSGRRPSTVARQKSPASRRSKSAEPGSLFNSHGSMFSPEHLRQCTATTEMERVPDGSADALRTCPRPGSMVLDLARPQQRRKMLPLVPNRADPEQVAGFFLDLRTAMEAGIGRFEEGIKDREQQRIDAKKRKMRVMVVGDELMEPMTHPEYILFVDKFLMALSELDDEYDSDEIEASRVNLFEDTRGTWHFARAFEPAHAKTTAQVANEKRESAKTPNGRAQRAKAPDLAKRPDLGATQKPKILSSLKCSQRGLVIDVKKHAQLIAAFDVMGVEPSATSVHLKNTSHFMTEKRMEALVQLFSESKGLVPLDTLLLTNSKISGVGVDYMAPYLRSCCTIKHLDLRNNNLCSRSATSIAGLRASLRPRVAADFSIVFYPILVCCKLALALYVYHFGCG